MLHSTTVCQDTLSGSCVPGLPVLGHRGSPTHCLQATPDKLRRLDLKPTSLEAQRGWGLALYSLPDIIFHGLPVAQIAVAEVCFFTYRNDGPHAWSRSLYDALARTFDAALHSTPCPTSSSTASQSPRSLSQG